MLSFEIHRYKPNRTSYAVNAILQKYLLSGYICFYFFLRFTSSLKNFRDKKKFSTKILQQIAQSQIDMLLNLSREQVS